jgi:hypothetical protein
MKRKKQKAMEEIAFRNLNIDMKGPNGKYLPTPKEKRIVLSGDSNERTGGFYVQTIGRSGGCSHPSQKVKILYHREVDWEGRETFVLFHFYEKKYIKFGDFKARFKSYSEMRGFVAGYVGLANAALNPDRVHIVK